MTETANPEFFELFDDFAASHPNEQWTRQGAESFVSDILTLMALDFIPEPVMAAIGRELQKPDRVVTILPERILANET